MKFVDCEFKINHQPYKAYTFPIFKMAIFSKDQR